MCWKLWEFPLSFAGGRGESAEAAWVRVLFAPKYHPAFKHVAAARKLCADRGQRTIFNFLGPLLNPGSPSCALIGVANPTLCEPLAKVLQSLGMHRGMVVCGQCRVGNEIANVDELSTIGQNTIAEFYQANGFTISESAPDLFPSRMQR